MISLLTTIVAMLIAAPFGYIAWRKGKKDEAVFYLILGAILGYIIGKYLFLEIVPGNL